MGREKSLLTQINIPLYGNRWEPGGNQTHCVKQSASWGRGPNNADKGASSHGDRQQAFQSVGDVSIVLGLIWSSLWAVTLVSLSYFPLPSSSPNTNTRTRMQPPISRHAVNITRRTQRTSLELSLKRDHSAGLYLHRRYPSNNFSLRLSQLLLPLLSEKNIPGIPNPLYLFML